MPSSLFGPPQPSGRQRSILTVAEEWAALTWVDVTSSNLKRIAYVPDSQRLWVEFLRKAGSNSRYHVYYYDAVPQHVYNELEAATSHGTYLDRHVKKAGYSYQPYL